jgi:hypothetical protein
MVHLLTYINEFTKSLGEESVMLDTGICESILRGMRLDFPHVDGLDEASAFKKIANFVTFFIANRPIPGPFSESSIGKDLAKISNHQNVIVAFQLAIDSLHGAVIHSNNGEDIKLENRIKLSPHSYIDIVDALHDATNHTHYKMATVLLEQLAYKSNPGCQYDLIDI